MKRWGMLPRQVTRQLVAAAVLSSALTPSCERHGNYSADHRNGVLTESTCESCRIESTVEITLGGHPDVILGEVNFVARTSDAGFLIASSPRLDEISVLDRDGRFVRTVGRPGRGPGEFGMIADIVWDGHGLFALDHGNRRITQFDSTYRHVRDITLAFAFTEMVRLDDSTFVTTGVVPTADGRGAPIHIVSDAGDLVRSVGGDSVPFDPGGSAERRIATARDGTFWSVVAGDHLLEHWGSDGELLQQIRRDDPWSGRIAEVNVDGPPPPPASVRAMSLDSVGVLWILSTLPDRQWRDVVKQVMNPGAVIPGYVITDNTKYYDTRLEAIDPASGAILATLMIDEYAHGFSDASHVLVSRSTNDGEPLIDVIEVHLLR